MFAIKLLDLITGSANVSPKPPNYQMISCSNFTVAYPDGNAVGGDSNLPIIGVWIEDGENLKYEGYPVRNVAYIINENGKTIDTVRPT